MGSPLAIRITLITCIATNCFAKDTLQTGEAIAVGTDAQVGVLALPSISCTPLGAAYVTGGKRPDLFLTSDRWHPGIYLYRWVKDDQAGSPIFSQPIEVTPPFDEAASSHGYLLTDATGQVFGFWLRGNKLVAAKFDPQSNRFETVSQTTILDLPANPGCVAIRLVDDKHLAGFITVGDGTILRPGDHRDKDYTPYDGAGIWRGGLPRDGIFRFTCPWPELPKAVDAEVVLAPEQGGLLGINSLEWIEPLQANSKLLLYGIKLGGMFFVPAAFDTSASLAEEKIHLTNTSGLAIRHPTVGTCMVAYPSAEGDRTDLIVAGEGGMYYYCFAKQFGERGEPVYESPRHVLQETPDLYDGSLVVPNLVDWNGDGSLDIVAGNAAGRLLFFENQGTNQEPRFLPASYLTSGGEPVLIRGGYRGSIQGPGEAHWGYTCPTVVDWDQDGLLDVLMHDIRGIHTVYMNRGTPTASDLSLPQQLNVESLELHGTWRTRPAVGLLGDRMAYVTLDDDDQVHLYWRIDDFNLEDGGKLLLTDGSPIQANFLPAGGTGRAKFQFVDWDQDGLVDLLVGTPRHGSFPEPTKGVPWSMNQAGSAVLLMKNVGSNEQPNYEYPAVMHVGGKSMHFGQHSCAPFATSLGSEDGKKLNLMVGTETGRMFFFRGEEIVWKKVY